MIEVVVLAGVTWLVSLAIKDRADRARATPPRPAPPPVRCVTAERMVALVGTANAGKSSTGNALLGRNAFHVGSIHGTTYEPQPAPFKAGYRLVDTPGLFDSRAPRGSPFDLRRAEIVVYVCTGQLLRPELDEVSRLVVMQRQSDEFSSRRRRRLLIYCNKRDVAAMSMSAADVNAQEAALRQQIDAVAPLSPVVFGTAGSELSGVGADVRSLASVLDTWMDTRNDQGEMR